MGVTIKDIAKKCGISITTVSLVLNQSRNIKLSDDTRQRVIGVATELGYDRLPAVHAPRNQEEIALLVSSMQSFDPFIDAISQAREAAWRNETLLTVYDYGDDIELALNIIRQLEKRNCIGIILASPVTTLVDMTAFQDCTRIPLVLLNQRDPGSPLLPQLAARFGGDILKPDGTLDRRLLADRAFATPEGKAALDSLTHPAIVARIRAAKQAAQTAGAPLFVLDGAVIVGTAAQAECDRLCVVTAPFETSVARIVARDGISPEMAARRLNAQTPERTLTAQADYTLHNDAGLEALQAAAARLCERLQAEGGVTAAL